jgi:transposase
LVEPGLVGLTSLRRTGLSEIDIRLYCTLNQDGDVVDRGRFRTTPKAIERWFTRPVSGICIAMEAGTDSIRVSEQLQELGHEVIVPNVHELLSISHSNRKSDQVDAAKLARFARLDPQILRPIGQMASRSSPENGILRKLAARHPLRPQITAKRIFHAPRIQQQPKPRSW